MTDRSGPPPLPSEDPSVLAILEALAFTTAAIAGDARNAAGTLEAGLRDRGAAFTDALISTVQLLADDAADHGIDVTTALREVGLGVQLAHLAEHLTTDVDTAPEPPTDRS
jgi:hypothetical protein